MLEPKQCSVATHGPRETERVGAELAASLEPGDVVLIAGELGSGKTTLIRGACRRLGVTEPVTSPTFTIGQRYRGRVGVSHLDLFRLASLEEEDPGLLDDYLTPDSIVFVEWPGVGGDALLGRSAEGRVVRVELRHAGGDERRISIEG